MEEAVVLLSVALTGETRTRVAPQRPAANLPDHQRSYVFLKAVAAGRVWQVWPMNRSRTGQRVREVLLQQSSSRRRRLSGSQLDGPTLW